MKELNVNITDNPYFWSPDGTTLLTGTFNFSKEISYIKLLLKYPVANFRGADLFKYLDDNAINSLKTGKSILTFDSTFEGFGPDEVPIAEALYQNCLMYNIDPKRIFLFTGNLIHRQEKINVIPIFLLSEPHSWSQNKIWSYEECKKRCERNYKKRMILSLSRRNRPHRVIAHCMLFNSELFHDSIISQDIVKTKFDDYTMNCMGLNKDQVDLFLNSLPLIADENNFEVNEPFNTLSRLHSKTLFSIVNETLACNLNNSTLFFSEKFLKPIINFQPMLIYGHQGINKKLSMLGFKTYEDYFNLSFDDEPNDILRYKKLLSSASEVVKFLKTLDKTQQIEWRFKNRDLLEYNYNVFLEHISSKESLKNFFSILEELD